MLECERVGVMSALIRSCLSRDISWYVMIGVGGGELEVLSCVGGCGGWGRSGW